MASWRIMFLIGMIPALLAVVIRGRLKEPERWSKAVGEAEAVKHRPGSIAELFGEHDGIQLRSTLRNPS